MCNTWDTCDILCENRRQRKHESQYYTGRNRSTRHQESIFSLNYMDKKTPCRLTSVLERLQRWLGGRHAIAWILLFTLALTAPSLINGLAGDDYFVRAVVLQNTEIPGVPASIFDAFPFTKGDPAVIRQGIEAGMYPWWTHPQHKISFFRPLSSLTHWVDFRLFPDALWLMHVHSLLWYGLLVYVAALLYRRFLSAPWAAALATLLYAIDYSHSVGAASLCNRYAVIAAVFGFLTVLAHDRWRHNGSKSCGALAIGCFTLALLTGEAGVAASAYLFAYAVFLDRGKPLARYAVLLPYVLVGVIWRIIYSGLEFGSAHSGVYIDPAQDPVRFAVELVQRLPVLLLGQLALPSSDGWAVLPALQAQIYVALALAAVFFCAWALWPLLRRDRATCFFGLGMILAAIPFCATLPSNRFLFFTGLGCMGMIASFLAVALERPAWFTGWGKPHKALAYTWIGIHIVLSPLLLVPLTLSPIVVHHPFARAEETIMLQQQSSTSARIIVVNVPSDIMLFHIPFIRAAAGRNDSPRTFLLSAGLIPVELQRVNDQTLVVRMPDGLLTGVWNQFFRSSGEPIAKGLPLKFSDVTVTVTGLTETGLPAEIKYEFAGPLEDHALTLVTWSEHGFVPFTLPRPGQTVTLQPLPSLWPLKSLLLSARNAAHSTKGRCILSVLFK